MTRVVNLANVSSYVTSNGISSTSNTSGALVVSGGVGVAGNVYAGLVYDSGVHLKSYIDIVYNKANTSSGSQNSFVTFLANGVSLTATSNTDTLTITSNTNDGIAIASNSTTKTINFGLQNLLVSNSGTPSTNSTITSLTIDEFGRTNTISYSAISGLKFEQGGTGATSYTAGAMLISNGTSFISLANTNTTGTYGNSTFVPVITTDAYGRISSVSNVAINSGGLTLSDNTVTNSNFYIPFSSTNTGNFTTAYINSSKLYFNPNTGTLSANTVSVKTIKESQVNLGNMTGTINIDWSAGDYFYGIVTGTTTLTCSNVPSSGSCQNIMLRLINGGAFTINFPTGSKYPSATLGSLTVSGTDLLNMIYDPVTTFFYITVIAKDIR